MLILFRKIEQRKGIRIEIPNPLNLQYRKQVSFLKDTFTTKYLDKFSKDMEHRFQTKVVEMTDEELILFAVKFLGTDKEYQYYYIYNNEEIIGEIYAYSSFKKNDYFFFIYISEEYRTQKNYIEALLQFEETMYSPFVNARRLYIDTEFLEIDDVLIKSNFRLDAIFHDERKRYICKEYMCRGMSIEKPTLEHEKKYRNFLKNNNCKNYDVFDYHKWLNNIEKKNKNRKEYFLMYYNNSLQDTEIVGVGHVLNNWKKTGCIDYEIEKHRRQTDFGKHFLEMLFEELDEDAEFLTLTCPTNDIQKIKEYENVLGDLIDNIYQKNGTTYFEMTLIVY